MSILALADEWREEAATYRRRGHEALAEMTESFAADLEARWREWWHEELTYAEAEEETGTPRSTLEKKVRRGELVNAGANGRPRLRRCNLFPGLAGMALTVVDNAIGEEVDRIVGKRLTRRPG